ncbi:MAG: hypothetical protein GX446_05260 [Chthonomonadales bacterium]|nr:hypothetical protein [Chthonomonadales bacterium]
MFQGTFPHNLDDKARVLLPVPFRDLVGEKVVLLYGPDGCVRGYPKEKWDEMLARGASTQAEWSTALRRYIGTATVVQREQNYRISVPEPMLEHAGLKWPCRAYITGIGVGFEIWERDRYQRYTGSTFVSGLLAEEARRAGMPELA